MKIEAGKYYKTRSGFRFYIATTNKPGDFPVCGWSDKGWVSEFTSDGRYKIEGQSNTDIISEWCDELVIPWDKLFPPWVKWFSVDEDGEQAGFELKPEASDGVWYVVGEGYTVLPQSQRIPFTGNWKESLTERK